MNKTFSIILSFSICCACKAQGPTVESVLAKYQKSIKEIHRLSYQANRIDTFPSGGIWDHTGTVLIERFKQDSILGINFWGKRDDYAKEYLYFQGFGYEISTKKKRYTKEPTNFGFLGSPGGQLVSVYMLYAEAGHESVRLGQDDQHYILEYTFKDDPVYDIRNRKRRVYLDRETYLPVKFIETKLQHDDRSFKQLTLTNIKINEEVETSIAEYRSTISHFKNKSPIKTKKEPSLIGKKYPAIHLPKISEQSVTVDSSAADPILLVFWEYWCGPCIKSLPELQKLSEAFEGKLQVVGISSSDPVKTAQIMQKRGIRFLNLLGNDKVLKAYKVNAFPNYFLIDKNGLIVKNYQAFDVNALTLAINNLLDK